MANHMTIRYASQVVLRRVACAEGRGHEEGGRKDERQLHRRDDGCQRPHAGFIMQSSGVVKAGLPSNTVESETDPRPEPAASCYWNFTGSPPSSETMVA